MSPTFTDDDVEKRVENAAGDAIGVVTAVEGDAARVEPRPGVMDSIRSALGWGRAREDAVYVHEDAVSEISKETIRVEGEPFDGGTGAESASEPDEGETGTEEPQPGLGPAPDEGVGRREREPGNAEPGSPAANARPSDDPSAEPASEPTESAIDTGVGFADNESNADASTADVEAEGGDAGPTDADANAAETDLIEEMNRGDEVDEAAVDPTDGAGDREESGTIPVDEEAVEPEEMEFLEEREHGDAADSVADVAEMNEVDESRIDAEPGVRTDFEPDEHRESGTRATVETDSATETDSTAEAETMRDVAGGVDVDSLEKAGDDRAAAGGTTRGEERDAADELELGTDPDTLEAVAETDVEAGERRGPDVGEPSGRVDPAGELDAGVGIESAVESDTDSAAGDRPDGSEAVDESGPATHRIVSDVAVEARSEPDDEVAAPAGDETAADERPTADAGSPVEVAVDAQRTAIAEGGRALTRGLRMQRELANLTVEMQTELGRKSIEQFASVTRTYVDTLATMAGADADREGRSTDREDRTDRDVDSAERIRELEAQLEHRMDVLEELREGPEGDESNERDSG